MRRFAGCVLFGLVAGAVIITGGGYLLLAYGPDNLASF